MVVPSCSIDSVGPPLSDGGRLAATGSLFDETFEFVSSAALDAPVGCCSGTSEEPVSTGTAVGSEELGAAGSVVRRACAVGIAIAVFFVSAIGGSNQKFGIRSLYIRQVELDHSGTRSRISVGMARLGLISLQMVPHSPVVGISVWAQSGHIGIPTGSHRA